LGGADITFPGGRGYEAPAKGKVGLVLLHEYWGLTPQIEETADRFAAAGFPTLALDLYDGKVAKTPEEAKALSAGLDRHAALGTLGAAGAVLRGKGARRLVTLGYCLGGGLSLAASAQAGLDGAVVFYGLSEGFDPASARVPLLLHYANDDEWCTPAKVGALEAALQAAGRRFELHRYDAKHAFCNDRRPEVHDPAATALAFERTTAWLRTLA
jgi:carboxymethylenebutenolidase